MPRHGQNKGIELEKGSFRDAPSPYFLELGKPSGTHFCLEGVVKQLG
jgi:hypothetical protein